MSNDSNDSFTEKFFTWMDSEGLKPRDLAPLLHKEVQTIFNWRSKGLPKAQWVACEAVMDRYNAEKIQALPDQDPVFVINPTYAQFQNWNRAALDGGKMMEDWAKDSLDEMAANTETDAVLNVAEDSPEYPSKDKPP